MGKGGKEREKRERERKRGHFAMSTFSFRTLTSKTLLLEYEIVARIVKSESERATKPPLYPLSEERLAKKKYAPPPNH